MDIVVRRPRGMIDPHAARPEFFNLWHGQAPQEVNGPWLSFDDSKSSFVPVFVAPGFQVLLDLLLGQVFDLEQCQVGVALLYLGLAPIEFPLVGLGLDLLERLGLVPWRLPRHRPGRLSGRSARR